MKKLYLFLGAFSFFNSSCSDRNRELIKFSKEGDLKKVQESLDAGADIEAHDEKYRTALMQAAKAGRLPVVRYLVDRGANPNTTYKVSEKSSHVALMGAMCRDTPENTETALFLLDHNADPLQRNWGNSTALMHAIYNKNELLLDRLLKYEGQEIYHQDVNHLSPLTYALGLKNIQVRQSTRKKLLEYDTQKNRAQYTDLTHAIVTYDDVKIQELLEQCSPNEKDQNGNYPLYLAVITENVSAVRNLLEKGADPNIQNSLYNAIKLNCLEIAKLLLEYGADANEYSIDGFTPLYLAIARNNLEVMELLLSNGANVNLRPFLHHSNYSGTPLLSAVKRNHLEAAKILIKYKANINQADSDGWTSLLSAVYDNNLEGVKLLLENNADLHHVLPETNYPVLLFAVNKKNPSMIQLFLEYKANVNQSDSDGWTPLLKSVYDKNIESTTLLLQHGANVNQALPKQGGGWTSLLIAVNNQDEESTQLLLDYGADINYTYIENNDEESALSIAINNMDCKMCQLLLDRGAKITEYIRELKKTEEINKLFQG